MLHELENLEVKNFDAGAVFSGKPTNQAVKGYSAPSSYAPTPDPNFIFQEVSRDVIVWFLAESDPIYVFGPTGSGKTSLLKEIAARLNYPVFEITGHSRLEFPEMVGHLTVKDKDMIYQYGPLALAMKFGGLFLLNEIDLLDPSTAAGLNTILDGSPLCIPENGGEIIKPHPMFRFAATANTNGASDETGLYNGCLRQNLAFMDRFTLCEVGYMDAKLETNLLCALYPKLPEEVARKMVSYANEVRRLFIGNAEGEAKLDITFSTRTIIRWANLTIRFGPLAKLSISPVLYALDRALALRANPETRTYLTELAQRTFSAGN